MSGNDEYSATCKEMLNVGNVHYQMNLAILMNYIQGNIALMFPYVKCGKVGMFTNK